MKSYEVIVTYRLYADNEEEATSQVLSNPGEPEEIDVLALPARKHLDVDLIPF